MRIVTLLFISFCFMFSMTLTSDQLELAKAAGYSEAQIKEQLNKSSNQTEQKTSQVINNNITKSENLFTKTSNVGGLEKDKKPETIKKVKKYGALFFNNKNTLNPYSIPTPTNYKLTFGDKISLVIYGSTNQEFNLSIDNNGNVTIPQVGELQLIGMNFSDAKELIKEETLKAFPNSTNILIDMLEYASIQVTISGFVNAPGLYNLSSFSTIKDALIASGGILENGSYRNIYLKRDGQIKKVFDLYQLVRYGNTSSDEMLENGDIILVKPIEKELILTGDINYEASFELKKGESFKDLVNYSAGFKPRANQNAIKLKRYESGSLKVYTLSKNELFKMTPKSGDEVHVYSTSTLGAKLVMIDGNVVAPGEREVPKDKKLSTLLKTELKQFGEKGYFKNDTNYNYGTVKNDNKIKSFNLQDVLDSKTDITLSAGDEIVIYKNDELQERPYVYVNGLVVDKSKQKYNFYKGMKAKDLFSLVRFKSDLTTDQGREQIHVDKSKIQISRIENNEKKVYLITKDDLSNFTLKKFDNIKFFEYSQVNNIHKATIKGEVFIPGTYDISKGTTLKEMVNISGGLTNKALMSKFELVRYDVKYNERDRVIMSLDLKNALEQNIEIKPDDEITIFPIANWNEKKYVELKGFVKYPGKYPIIEGEKLSSVIQRAGGFLDQAFLEGSVFTREEVRELQIKRLEESISRIKSRVAQSNLSATDAGEEAKEKQNMFNTVKMIEKESSLNKPIGRITLELFKDMETFKASKYDISLKDKDTLYIPSINDTVSVVGEVLNQTTFVYDKDLNAYNYLEKAGGLNETADSDLIYIVKANGEAIKVDSGYFWNDTSKIYKGDTIVVPMKIDTVSDISMAKDITSILYQLAITAASIKTLGAL